MATAFREPAMTGLRSKSFTVAPAPLTPIERIALECLKQIAGDGRQATQAEILAAIGSQAVATAPGIVRRLEQKGYITRSQFQRGFQVCIVETGQCTTPPHDTSPHWRLRTDRPPTPAIQSVRDRSKPIAALIEAEGRVLGKHHSDWLADLVYIGWHAYQAEKEGSA